MMISVIIPVFNEEKTIMDIIKRVQDVDIEKEIIIVDDGSTDKTREILRNIKEGNIRVIYHDKNLGKGGALKTGFSHAKGDIIIPQDADLELDPKEYHNLIEPILEGYRSFLTGNAKLLRETNQRLDRAAQREFPGRNQAVAGRERLMTTIYNYFALPPARTEFCQAAPEVFTGY